MAEHLTGGGHCCSERPSCRPFPLRQVTSDVVAPIAVVRRRSGHTATRISSSNRRCLGENCQSSGLYGPVGSGQVRLGRHSVECGLVGCSRAWWNDRQNDHLSKRLEALEATCEHHMGGHRPDGRSWNAGQRESPRGLPLTLARRTSHCLLARIPRPGSGLPVDCMHAQVFQLRAG
jgi:hypothetical protein